MMNEYYEKGQLDKIPFGASLITPQKEIKKEVNEIKLWVVTSAIIISAILIYWSLNAIYYSAMIRALGER